MSRGIDYGMGRTNIDLETGIRFGVIPIHDVTQAWCESSEGDYGPPSCPKCGNEAVPIDNEEVPDIDEEDDWEDDGRDFACLSCRYSFDNDDAWGDEPVYGFNLDDGEYKCHQAHDDCDIFVIKSPYYTYGPFCSPCAPGAVYLRNGSEEGEKAYCFAPDWFEWWEGEEATGEYNGQKTTCPYPVFRVEDDVCVFAPKSA